MNLINVFLSFSLVVSSTYIFNDFVDIKSDKMHPTKKYRPIASGSQTKVFWTICALISFAIGNFFLNQINTQLLIYSFTYVLVTVTYSIYFKYIKFLDIISIAFLFLIRLFLEVVQQIPLYLIGLCCLFFYMFRFNWEEIVNFIKYRH